ncbi:MAG TPA: beta-propeller fold lactonase family protein [Chloroflexota bacterium]|nr:beta-propeller fold lactonase family protein [Chloroflexota bacterium]
MRIPARVSLLASVLSLSLSAVAAGGLPHASAQPDRTGYVYVNDNTAGTNTIAAFSRGDDGGLAPLPGSPFSAGGAGTGAILGSAGAIQLTNDGRYVLAVDAGSSQISILQVGPGGALQAIGSPVSSGGIEPVSLAVHGDLVYVANEGNGATGSNYTGFILGPGGQLTPIANSTVALPPTAAPGDIVFNATGTHVIGTEVGPSAGPSFIDSFVVGSDGRLTAAPGSPFPAQAVGPFGSAFSPENPNQLYVSNAHAGANLGTVSAYNVGSDGTLAGIGASPFPDKQTAPCWVEISPDGRYLFAVNTAVPSISRYHILDDGSLSLIGSTVFNDPTGLRPFDLRLDPRGNSLYVVDAGLARVSAFTVRGGRLHEIAASPIALPTGATPFGIVVD